MNRLILMTACVLAFSIAGMAQTIPARKAPAIADASTSSLLRATPAYAEVLLHKTELEAELEALLMEYTEDYPRVKDLRVELEVLKPEIDRIIAVKPSDSGKLTQALGKLILGKVAHAATLKKLQSQFQDAHPSVKKEKRMVEIFEAAIKEILG